VIFSYKPPSKLKNIKKYKLIIAERGGVKSIGYGLDLT
jgi:hypothetical protein